MRLGSAVEAPWGFISLCARSPLDCVVENTPQARAKAALDARALMKARWEKAMQLAARRGILPRPAVPASIGTGGGGAPGPASYAEAVAAGLTGEPSAAKPWRIELKTFGRTMKRINAHVNRAIRPGSDVQTYGVSDWWVAPLSTGAAPVGDCKDYALEKRRELIAAGAPAQALSIALVRTLWGESHAVLVVATDQGDFVLDNLDRKIRPWTQAPYHWEARQSAEDPMVWLQVLPGATSASG